MKLDIDVLINILTEQKNRIEELLKIADEQLQALKQDELDKIISLTNHQEYIAGQITVLEQKRKSILEEYSQKLGIEINSFSKLLFYIKDNDQEKILELSQEIIEICQKLSEVNELNTFLLKQSLAYTERVLGVFNRKNSLVYGKAGDMHRAANKGIIDTSA